MQEGNPYYNLYNNDGAAAAAAYSYASAGGGTSGSSCAKDYKDYKDYSYYGSYFNQVSCSALAQLLGLVNGNCYNFFSLEIDIHEYCIS